MRRQASRSRHGEQRGPGSPRSRGSVHAQRGDTRDIVKGSGEFTAFAVHVGLHVGDEVVGLFPSQVLVQLLPGSHKASLRSFSVSLLGLTADHEGQVLVQGDVAVPVWIHSVQTGLKRGVGLPFLHHGQAIAQGGLLAQRSSGLPG